MAKDDISRVNTSLAQEAEGVWLPGGDPDHPRDVDPSHRMAPKGAYCEGCGTRPWWALAEAPCPAPCALVPRGAVVLGAAIEALRADLELFGEWWSRHHAGQACDDLNLWAAEFFEWRRTRGKKGARK